MAKEPKAGLPQIGGMERRTDAEKFIAPELFGDEHLLPVPPRKGPGRPAGSKNRLNNAIRDRYLSRWAHPLDVLGAISSTPVRELAKTLEIKTSDAAQIVVRAAVEALPYIESKRPTVVDLGESLPVLIMGGKLAVDHPQAAQVRETFPELAPLIIDGEASELPDIIDELGEAAKGASRETGGDAVSRADDPSE